MTKYNIKITSTIAGTIYIIKIDDDIFDLPANLKRATAYAPGIEKNKLTKTVTNETIVLFKAKFKKLY